MTPAPTPQGGSSNAEVEFQKKFGVAPSSPSDGQFTKEWRATFRHVSHESPQETLDAGCLKFVAISTYRHVQSERSQPIAGQLEVSLGNDERNNREKAGD